MPILKNPEKYDFLTRVFLTRGENIAYKLPAILSIFTTAFFALLLKKGVSKELEIVLMLLSLSQVVVLTIGVALAINLRFRRAEHARLIQYIESLRQYTVNGLNTADKNFAELGEMIFPPPAEVPQSTPDDLDEKPLRTRERNTLLALVGVLCKEAGIDWKKPAAAAAAIKLAAEQMEIRIGESTIEEHLKRVPSALEARSF